jgi:hypothetical protein
MNVFKAGLKPFRLCHQEAGMDLLLKKLQWYLHGLEW